MKINRFLLYLLTFALILLPAAASADPPQDEPLHKHDWVVTSEKAATCTEAGNKTWTCRDCKQTYTETVPALGHSWDGGSVTTAATCTAEGVKTYTCTRCKATKTEAISKTAHTPVTVTGKAATCTEAGLTDGSKCSVCGAVITAQQSIPAKGHTPTAVAGKAATCTEAGLTDGQKCSVCGAVLKAQQSIAAKGHDWITKTKEPDGLTDGETFTVCTRCGQKKNYATIPAAPAMFNLLRNVPPSAAEAGDMVVTLEPEGGEIAGDVGYYVLFTAVEGGVEPYTYEWHWNPSVSMESDEATRFVKAMAQQAAAQYSAGKANAAAALHGAFGKQHAQATASSKNTSTFAYGGTMYAKGLETTKVDLNDRNMGSGDGTSYAASAPGTYYCIIRDSAGHWVSTQDAQVIYGLRIVTEPTNTNINGLSSVNLYCQAAGGDPFTGEGKAPYDYVWFSKGGDTIGQYASPAVITEPGEYYCVAQDQSGARATSKIVTVYDAPRLTVTPEQDYYDLATIDGTADVKMHISGGVAPYTCVWNIDGQTLESFTTSESEVSYPSAQRGTYSLTVTDADKDNQVGTVSVGLPLLTIKQQPVGGVLEEFGSLRRCDIEIEMAGDGVSPYIFMLYRNNTWYASGVAEYWYKFPAWDPGEYYIHVQDQEGRHADSNHVIVVADSKPIITLQPNSIELDYREDGVYDVSFTCQAVTGSGESRPLDYQWEFKMNDGIWYPVGNERGETSTWGWSGVEEGIIGQYRVIVTDPENGESINSRIVTASVAITSKVQINYNRYEGYLIEGEIKGGIAPYTVYIYQHRITGMEPNYETNMMEYVYADVLVDTIVVNDTGSIRQGLGNTITYEYVAYDPQEGKYGVHTVSADYYIVIIDDAGHEYQSDPVSK